MSLPNPLLKILRTKEGVYVYSGHTNVIIQLAEEQAKILEYFGKFDETYIINELKDKYNLEKLKRGYKELEGYHKKYNLFSKGIFKSRISRFTDKDLKKELDSGIEKISLEVTENCNFRCKYCSYSGGYKDNRKHGNRNMSMKTAKTAIDFYHSNFLSSRKENIRQDNDKSANKSKQIKGLSFYGGEPLLRFNFIKSCIEYFENLDWKGSKIQHSITTNGSLLNDEIIDFFLGHNIVPSFSLDGPKSEHDSNRIFKNGKGSFDKVYNNILKFRKKVIERPTNKSPEDIYIFNILCVISPMVNLLKLNDFFGSFFDDNIFVNLAVSYVNQGNPSYFKKYPFHPERAKHADFLDQLYMKEVINGSYIYNSPANCFIEQFVGANYLEFFKHTKLAKVEDVLHLTGMCIPGKNKPLVSVDGNIHVCERISPFVPIGNIWDGFDIPKIRKLWNEFADLMDMEDCRSCWALWNCGRCFAGILDNKNFSKEKKLEKCENIRNHVEKDTTSFCSILEQNPKAFDHYKNFTF